MQSQIFQFADLSENFLELKTFLSETRRVKQTNLQYM